MKTKAIQNFLWSYLAMLCVIWSLLQQPMYSSSNLRRWCYLSTRFFLHFVLLQRTHFVLVDISANSGLIRETFYWNLKWNYTRFLTQQGTDWVFASAVSVLKVYCGNSAYSRPFYSNFHGRWSLVRSERYWIVILWSGLFLFLYILSCAANSAFVSSVSTV